MHTRKFATSCLVMGKRSIKVKFYIFWIFFDIWMFVTLTKIGNVNMPFGF